MGATVGPKNNTHVESEPPRGQRQGSIHGVGGVTISGKAAVRHVFETGTIPGICGRMHGPVKAIMEAAELVLSTPLTGEQRRHLETVRKSADSLLAFLKEAGDDWGRVPRQ